MQIGFILSLIFAIIVTVFAIQNAGDVEIKFLYAKVEISQALVIFISAALGAIIVTILGLFREFKSKMKIKDLNKTISKLSEENNRYEEQLTKNSLEKNDSNTEEVTKEDKEIKEIKENQDKKDENNEKENSL
ncbi:MAG: LapA family protein [Firmicutes bacterium]|nr:LapA family protein [Bacillota bacterium]